MTESKVATEKEYLEWFYHTIRHMYKGVDGFEYSLAERFKRETAKICPFYIKKSTTNTSSTQMTKEWTAGRLKSFITTTLRSGMRRYPPKYEALKNAYTCTKINPKSGRNAKHYRCAGCNGDFPSKDVNVDHKDPVVSSSGFVDWNTFIDRLFCGVGNLQVLCGVCHDKKTAKERGERKK